MEDKAFTPAAADAGSEEEKKNLLKRLMEAIRKLFLRRGGRYEALKEDIEEIQDAIAYLSDIAPADSDAMKALEKVTGMAEGCLSVPDDRLSEALRETSAEISRLSREYTAKGVAEYPDIADAVSASWNADGKLYAGQDGSVIMESGGRLKRFVLEKTEDGKLRASVSPLKEIPDGFCPIPVPENADAWTAGTRILNTLCEGRGVFLRRQQHDIEAELEKRGMSVFSDSFEKDDDLWNCVYDKENATITLYDKTEDNVVELKKTDRTITAAYADGRDGSPAVVGGWKEENGVIKAELTGSPAPYVARTVTENPLAAGFLAYNGVTKTDKLRRKAWDRVKPECLPKTEAYANRINGETPNGVKISLIGGRAEDRAESTYIRGDYKDGRSVYLTFTAEGSPDAVYIREVKGGALRRAAGPDGRMDGMYKADADAWALTKPFRECFEKPEKIKTERTEK